MPPQRKTPTDRSLKGAPSLDDFPERNPIRVFISHDHDRDAAIAAVLVNFLQGGLDLPDKAIRCTSLARCQLPNGAKTDTQLLDELRAADVLIGVVTPTSRRSDWVLFELGSRWGAGLHFAAVLHPHADYDILPAPIRNNIAPKLNDRARMLRLLHEVSERTGVRARGPVQTDEAITALMDFAAKLPPLDIVPASAPPTTTGESLNDGVRGLVRSSVAGGASTLLAERLSKMGARSDVLPVVLMEQAALVRHQMTRVPAGRVLGLVDQPPSYSRAHLENLRLTVAHYIDLDRHGSREGLRQFGRHLFEELNIKGVVYETEFQEQTHFLASEIRVAFGESSFSLLDEIVRGFEERVPNDIHRLRNSLLPSVARTIPMPVGPPGPLPARPNERIRVRLGNGETGYLSEVRWRSERGEDVDLVAKVYKQPTGAYCLGDVSGTVIAKVRRKGSRWHWSVLSIPDFHEVMVGTAPNHETARDRVLEELEDFAPQIRDLVG